ncbi:AAA domain-containing protein [Gallaecimonas sp. GXIMD4217]|uniref:DEAD/DEAH box helicase n=1 Tax=Gallaecimonas sp. GXIMD4217 TaxID=3131927 RepID=UPI00311B184F
MDRTRRLIRFYQQCYQADSRELQLSDLLKLKDEQLFVLGGEEHLASGFLARAPLPLAQFEALDKGVRLYQRERQLVYGLLPVCGRLPASGLNNSRRLCAPLLYCDAELERDEDGFVALGGGFQANLPLLRLLLDEDGGEALATFPVPGARLGASEVSAIRQWLARHAGLDQSDELGWWPRLCDEARLKSACRRHSLSVQCAALVALVERPRGARGVLHELELLQQDALPQTALDALLGQPGPVQAGRTTPELLPGLLSQAQRQALANAAALGLSAISGPPGTGKSYSIAAMAVDRMLQGQSVLLVSKTEQAVDVLAHKLKTDFGIVEGVIRGGDHGQQRQLKADLDSLLAEGPLPPSVEASARASRRQLREHLARQRKHSRILDAQLAAAQRRGERLARLESGRGSLADKLLMPLLQRLAPQQSLLAAMEQLRGHTRAQLRAARDHVQRQRFEQLQWVLDNKRQTLLQFQKALRARRSSAQQQYFEALEDDALLKAFPLWLCSLEALHKVLPLKAGQFDLVIIDEASQCDLASCLPALYRARRAVVVGDSKQLRHVSFLSRDKEQQLAQEGGLTDAPPLGYRDHSLLDAALAALPSQQAVTALDEHFRSRPELIRFSNRHFYRDRLKIMQDRPALTDFALKLHRQHGRRHARGHNEQEADAVLTRVLDHVERYAGAGAKPSIGVCSPFRAQVAHLEKRLLQALDGQAIEEFRLRIATPYGFQGEERDLMLLSFAVDEQSGRAAAYLNREDMFNVAVTRAKERLEIFHSLDPEQLPQGNLLRRYLEFDHGQTREDVGAPHCAFADQVREALAGLGIHCWQGFPMAGRELDLVCRLGDRHLAIDLVGYPGYWHQAFDLDYYQLLHRAGLALVPLSYERWQRRPGDCLAEIRALLTAP